MEDFRAISISYRETPLEIRERIALSEKQSQDFLLKMKDVLNISESLVVSTCNRTEIYYSSSENLDKEVISLLAGVKLVSSDSISRYVKRLDTYLAIDHLFSVSLGLDSQVLGDIQISNQVKRAYQTSADLEMAGPFLHRLMHTIFFANKRVVQETRLQDGNASTASVSVELVKGFIENIAKPRIALIGLGEIGQNVLENLEGLEASIVLLNRTKSKAEKLATLENVSVADLSEMKEVINESDVIISAVTPQDGAMIVSDHIDKDSVYHKLFVDLSVPRSIDASIGEIPGVALYNIDQLAEKTEKTRRIREKAIPEVKEIVKEAVKGFDQWKVEMEVSPTINKLKNALDQIRKEELSRHAPKVSEKEMKLLEVVTKNMIQRVIKLPVLQLKAACKRGESETLVGVLNDLFNLEPDSVEKGQ